MKYKYDIVLHYEWIHISHIHKYLALHAALKQYFNTLLIFNNEEGDCALFGVSKERLKPFNIEHMDDIWHCNMEEASSRLMNTEMKVYVFSSGGIKGDREIPIKCNKRQIPTVQTSDLYGDLFFCTNAKIVSLINQDMAKTLTYKPELWYSNCFLWDKIDEFLPYQLTKNEYCNKYNLDINKPIILWLPTSNCKEIPHPKIYNKVCAIDNVAVKLHPKEYKMIEFGAKPSYDLYGNGKKPIDAIDNHWAYLYSDCAIVHNTSTVCELPIYNLPVVCVALKQSPLLTVFRPRMPGSKFKWVGSQCELNELQSHLDSQQYLKNIDKNTYDAFLKLVLHDPNHTGIELLVQQLREFIGKMI